MTSLIVKPVGVETVCNNTANTFAYTSWATNGANSAYANAGLTTGASMVRLFNSTVTSVLITRSANSSVVIGTITLGPNQEMYIAKEPTDLLASNSAAVGVFAAPVAFKGG